MHAENSVTKTRDVCLNPKHKPARFDRLKILYRCNVRDENDRAQWQRDQRPIVAFGVSIPARYSPQPTTHAPPVFTQKQNSGRKYIRVSQFDPLAPSKSVHQRRFRYWLTRYPAYDVRKRPNQGMLGRCLLFLSQSLYLLIRTFKSQTSRNF